MVSIDLVNGIYARVENKPGNLERVGRALAERNVKIDALGLETSGSSGFVRILTPKAREALDALKTAGIECYESQLVVAHMPTKPESLGQLAAELAAARINIEGVLTTGDGRLALRTSDNERAAPILRKL